MLTNSADIETYRLKVIARGLKLEIDTGMRSSRNQVFLAAKKITGKKTREACLEAINKIIGWSGRAGHLIKLPLLSTNKTLTYTAIMTARHVISNKVPLNDEQSAEFQLMSRPVVSLKHGVTKFGLTKDAANFNRRKKAELQFSREYYNII